MRNCAGITIVAQNKAHPLIECLQCGNILKYWSLAPCYKSRVARGNVFDKKSEKFMMICQSQGKNKIVLANDLENVDITYFDSTFCQKNKSYQCYFLLNWRQIGVREKQFKSGLLKT